MAPLEFEKKAVNLSLYGATFVENYYSLKEYLEGAPKGKKILISNSYNWDYKRKYEFGPHFIRNGYYTKNKAIELLGEDASLNYYLYRFSLRGVSLHQLQTAFLNHSEIKHTNHIIEMLSIVNRGATLYKRPFKSRKMIQPYHSQLKSYFSASSLNDEYLIKTINLAKSMGHEVYFIEPPRLTEINARTSLFDQQLKNHLLNISSKFGVSFLEYTMPKLDESDFFDYDHLLEAGARKYSKAIAEALSGS